jgi:hypothetical protein
MSLLLHLYPEWIKYEKLNLHMNHQFILLSSVVPKKSELNRGNKNVEHGFRADGKLANMPKVDSIDSLLPEDWTFGHFVKGVIENTIDCDAIPIFGDFINDYIVQLNKEYESFEIKPIYSPKVTEDILSPDVDEETETVPEVQVGAPKSIQPLDNLRTEIGKGLGKKSGGGGGPKKSFNKKATSYLKTMKNVFTWTDEGVLSETAAGLNLKEKDLGKMIAEMAKKGLVKHIVFHDDKIKQQIEDEAAPILQEKNFKLVFDKSVEDAKIAKEESKKRKSDDGPGSAKKKAKGSGK